MSSSTWQDVGAAFGVGVSSGEEAASDAAAESTEVDRQRYDAAVERGDPAYLAAENYIGSASESFDAAGSYFDAGATAGAEDYDAASGLYDESADMYRAGATAGAGDYDAATAAYQRGADIGNEDYAFYQENIQPRYQQEVERTFSDAYGQEQRNRADVDYQRGVSQAEQQRSAQGMAMGLSPEDLAAGGAGRDAMQALGRAGAMNSAQNDLYARRMSVLQPGMEGSGAARTAMQGNQALGAGRADIGSRRSNDAFTSAAGVGAVGGARQSLGGARAYDQFTAGQGQAAVGAGRVAQGGAQTGVANGMVNMYTGQGDPGAENAGYDYGSGQAGSDRLFNTIGMIGSAIGGGTTSSPPPMAEGGVVRRMAAGGPVSAANGAMARHQQVNPRMDFTGEGEDGKTGLARLAEKGARAAGTYFSGGAAAAMADGGVMAGPGDGMSDSIPTTMEGTGEQGPNVARGEFIFPADAAAWIGYSRLQKMVQQARTQMEQGYDPGPRSMVGGEGAPQTDEPRRMPMAA